MLWFGVPWLVIRGVLAGMEEEPRTCCAARFGLCDAEAGANDAGEDVAGLRVPLAERATGSSGRMRSARTGRLRGGRKTRNRWGAGFRRDRGFMRLWFRLLPSCGRDEARWYGHGVLAAVLFTHTNILQKEIRSYTIYTV